MTGNIYPQRLLTAVLHSTFQGRRVCLFVLPTTSLRQAQRFWRAELPECLVRVVPLSLDPAEWQPQLQRLTYAPVSELPDVWVFTDLAYTAEHKCMLGELSGYPILLARTLIPGLVNEWQA